MKSPLYVALCPDPPAREEREKRRQDGVELAKREEGGREGRWKEDKEGRGEGGRG